MAAKIAALLYYQIYIKNNFCERRRYCPTPMMKQFLDLKAKHPDAVMLFRCGDFYETYSTDAVVAAEILGSNLLLSVPMVKERLLK